MMMLMFMFMLMMMLMMMMMTVLLVVTKRSGFPTAEPGLEQSMELEFGVSQLHSHRYEIQFQQYLLRQT